MQDETDVTYCQMLRRLPEVCRQTGLSAATLYRKIKAATFPAPVKLGARASAWVGAEVDEWIASCIAGRDAGLHKAAIIDTHNPAGMRKLPRSCSAIRKARSRRVHAATCAQRPTATQRLGVSYE